MKRLICLLLLLLTLSGCAEAGAPLATAAQSQSEATIDALEYIEAHFLDVGQADSILLLCGGQSMLIDGGNVADSSYVVAYLKKLGVTHIDHMVCTHAHEDHVGGLSGPLNTCTVGAVYSPVTSYDSKAFSDFTGYVEKQGLELTIPAPGDEWTLGGAVVRVLGPVKQYDDNTNNTSLVLRVDFGETSFLFTGDAERAAEQDMLDSGAELSATLLRVGHHGSNTSTTYPFLREIMPRYAVIQVGEGNDYGHPTEAVLSRLHDADTTVYRTDLHGAIVARSDGVTIDFEIERGAPSPGRETAATMPERVYIGNAKSKVFHIDSCSSLPAEGNRVMFEDRREAVDQGYKPCGNCKP